jgi:ferredoxin
MRRRCCNIHRVLPAEQPVMVGSGNVGLIVSYQLLQAGAKMRGIIEIQDKIGGYEVHAAKIRGAGVSFYLQSGIIRAFGEKSVEGIEIENTASGTREAIETDGIFLSVGLTPRTELAQMFGCKLLYEQALGGFLPRHDSDMRTSVPSVFIAGDAAGIEEANTALDEGRLAGVAAAADCGYINQAEADILKREIRQRLTALRSGVHSFERLEAKARITGNEASALTGTKLHAAPACDDIQTAGFSVPGYSRDRLRRGFVPVIDCPEPIPCNPCVDVCPSGAISMEDVCDKPLLDTNKCTGCMKCIAVCPGLAIRAVCLAGGGRVALPYEYLPPPEKNTVVRLTDGERNIIGTGRIEKVMTSGAFDKTVIVVVSVPEDLTFTVKGFNHER